MKTLFVEMRIDSLVKKLLKSEITSKERKVLSGVLEQDLTKKRFVKEKLYEEFQVSSEDYEEAFAHFEKAIQQQEKKRGVRKLFLVKGVAASVVMLLGFVFMYRATQTSTAYNTSGTNAVKDIILTTPNGEQRVLQPGEIGDTKVRDLIAEAIIGNANSEALSTIYVPKGMTYKMKLADGTLVHLNADSELKFPIAFGINTRKVDVRGEAFFEVVTNKKKPFIVGMGALETKVYGTKFNVSNYNTNHINEITLVEGSVGVTDTVSGKEIKIVPNEMYSWDKTSKSSTIEKVDINDKISWIKGAVVFKNSTLAEMIPVIERKFDIKVAVLDTEINSKKFSGKLTVNTVEELQAILEAMKIFRCQYYANNKRLVIKPM